MHCKLTLASDSAVLVQDRRHLEPTNAFPVSALGLEVHCLALLVEVARIVDGRLCKEREQTMAVKRMAAAIAQQYRNLSIQLIMAYCSSFLIF